MIDWSKYSIDEIKDGADDNGNRLLSLFARDYKDSTGKTICPTCPKFKRQVSELIQNSSIMKNKEKCEYKLKPMYNGIPMPGKFGTNEYVSNGNLTNKKAKELISKHQKGLGLFAIVPKTDPVSETSERVDELVNNNNAAGLKKIAEELGVEDLTGTKKDVAERIEAKEIEIAQKPVE